MKKLLWLLSPVLLVLGCAGLRDRSELDVPPFDPAYFRAPDRAHVAFNLEVVDGLLRPSSRPAVRRPGYLPSHPPGDGPFVLVYRDRMGVEIGRYALEDPAEARSCDLRESVRGSRRILRNGTIEVLIPADPDIAILELIPAGGPPLRFDVEEQVRAALG